MLRGSWFLARSLGSVLLGVTHGVASPEGVFSLTKLSRADVLQSVGLRGASQVTSERGISLGAGGWALGLSPLSKSSVGPFSVTDFIALLPDACTQSGPERART